ncbi:MAG: GntR family transcriptional regulator [Solirubrobacterales bacterium]|nr:GntR family transcriptional regulator [Solirubrobacterales bacterium]
MRRALNRFSRSSIGGNTGDRVYAILREAIVTAELEPGRQLSENELAELLGVSRTPVRGALARLREDRLVAIVPQLGSFVTLISRSGVEDAAFVREALECAAIRLAAERITESGLEEIQANLAAQERAERELDVESFDLLDETLHRIICQQAGHEVAWALSRRANGHLDRVRRLSLPDSSYLTEMVSEHKSLVAAVAEGDPDRAETELRRHLRMVLSSVDQIRVRHPEYFEDE